MRQQNWSYGPKQNIALNVALVDDWILILEQRCDVKESFLSVFSHEPPPLNNNMSDRVPNNSEMRYEKKSRQLPAQSVLTFNNRPTWTNNKNISDTFLPLLLYKLKHIWFRRAFIFCYDSNDVISIGLCPSVWEFHYSASALLLSSSTIAAAPGWTWTLSSVSPSKADNLLAIKAIYYDMLLADSYF